MSLIGYRGICMSCGHDHGDGFLSPQMERVLLSTNAVEVELQAQIDELQKEVDAWREQVAAHYALRVISLNEAATKEQWELVNVRCHRAGEAHRYYERQTIEKEKENADD
jgi:hypothetical protein